MEIKPLINAKQLGEVINYVSSLNCLPQVLKLIILTSVTCLFDIYNSLFFKQDNFIEQAEKYVQNELARHRQDKRVAIVTGANTGIGLLTAKYLAKSGYRVILGCRDFVKANEAIKNIKSDLDKSAEIEYISLDLAELSSVRRFVKSFIEKDLPLHVIINNAGVMSLSSSDITKDGLEKHFQVNYLSHFLLVELLSPCLSKDDPRIIFLGSLVHYGAGYFSLKNFQPKSFDPSSGYLNSKLAVTFLAHVLSLKLKDEGVFVGVADPGTTSTELFRSVPVPSWICNLIMRPPEAGVLSTLKLALGDCPNNDKWLYYMSETSIAPKSIVFNVSYQEALYKMSKQLTCLDS